MCIRDRLYSVKYIRDFPATPPFGGEFYLYKLWKPDPDDKTTVFDYIDEEWLTLVYQKIETVMSSDLYRGDGSFEHRLAYLCVTINLSHSFANGNKRSSLLVLVVLIAYARPDDLFLSLTSRRNEMYKTAKAIARGGESARDDNIVKLRELLKG